MKKIILILIYMVGLSALFAQSADVVTEIINAKRVTYGQVCYLSAVHQQLVTDDASYADCVAALYEKKQIESEYDASKPARLSDIAYIYMKMWPKQKGGFMYRITGGSKRYAYKYLKDTGIILSYQDENQYISGRDALDILTACMMEFAPVEEGMSLQIVDDLSIEEAPVQVDDDVNIKETEGEE